MTAKLIEFYFDFASPYAYFASKQIDRLCEEAACSVVWRPMLLGAAFQATGNKPLTEQPLKSEYAKRDLDRTARYLGVPWRFPDAFPVLTLGAARAFYWLEEAEGFPRAKALAQAALDTYFGEGRDISDKAVLADVAAKAGVDPAAMAEAIQREDIKQRLKDETAEAVERGVFGAPFFFVDGEPFWGQDRIAMIREWVERGGW